MDTSRRNELLDVIDRYAQHLEAAGQLEQTDTITTGQALVELFEDGSWVEEWLQQKPRPARPSNRWKADSFSRFTQWAMWKAEQTGRRSVVGRHQYRLRDAVGILTDLTEQVSNLTPGQIRDERRLRPLKWMNREGYEDRKGEVWAIALEDAGSVDAITEDVMRSAVNEWKRRHLAPRTQRGPRRRRADQLRVQAYSTLSELIALARKDPYAKEQLELLLKQAQHTMETGQWVSGEDLAA